MKTFIQLAVLLISIAFIACQTEAPSEDEIRAKLIGEYCAYGDNTYRLVITDSIYRSVRYSPGVLTQTPIRESCTGTYLLAYEGSQWLIRFAADEDPEATIENCQSEYPIWNSTEGFLIGEEDITLKELFDGEEVTRAECEP